MPEQPVSKAHHHPIKTGTPKLVPVEGDGASGAHVGPDYAELHAVSNFTFLRGASHPDELVQEAARLGYRALALTDEHSLAGVVRAHITARDLGFKLIVGAEVPLEDAATVLLLSTDRAAYGRLVRLLTLGRRRAGKGKCRLAKADLAAHADGLIALGLADEAALRPRSDRAALDAAADRLRFLSEVFGERAHLAASLHEGGDDGARFFRYEALERSTGLPLVATGAVEAHASSRRALRDVLHAVRHGVPVAALGDRLPPHGVATLTPREIIARRFAARPDMIERTTAIAARCTFSLAELRYEYPDEVRGRDLRQLVEQGAAIRWPGGVPPKVRALIEHEMALIEDLKYESYFLTVYDIVHFARAREILCQGRGSAANSAVCFALGITAVDPDRFDVLFERFISRDRNEPPDIDIDFEHSRREEVLQYVYERYGRERAALAATVITYRARSAVRDVGKAMGLSLDQVDRLAKTLHHWHETPEPEEIRGEAGVDVQDKTVRRVLRLARDLQGFPRHLSQHVGGMVITRGRLDEIVPIENAAMADRTVIQWDKDDLDALGILKVDCLALGMLTAIRKAFDLVERARGKRWELATIPAESRAVYAMCGKADTVGVFQIESRAQMAMLPRFLPKCFYDLVIEVAIVRPGPIQGGMVHPYLRRRAGKEEVTYPSPDVASVLAKTLGVPIFQEQVMKLAVVAAGFTPGEADMLRRAMGAWRRPGIIVQFGEKLISGMLARGYERAFAEAVYEQIKGFGEYGFPESHAASFALLTYVSCWLKRFEPAAFTAALLNSQPMGFYAPSQLVTDAKKHGVTVRPIDVTRSDFDCTLEVDDAATLFDTPEAPDLFEEEWGRGGPALRLGMRQVKGFSQAAAERLMTARMEQPFTSVDDCRERARLSQRDATLLAEGGAFAALSRHRRAAAWQATAPIEPVPLFVREPPSDEANDLTPPTLGDHVLADYLRCGLSIEAHPLGLLRRSLSRRGIMSSEGLKKARHGQRVSVLGLAICRQRPGTASGILFITLEDEHGFVNLVVRVAEQERYRAAILGSTLLLARGHVEREGEVIHVLVRSAEDHSALLAGLPTRSRDFH